MAGYYRKAEAVLGKTGCKCWDCLRAVGVTPPKGMRDKHRRWYPDREMHETGGYGNKAGGDPVETRGAGSSEEKPSGTTAEERAHLRSAVANREAI